ncbi:hypothetical protein EDD86DRAFT_186666 [Gorgonomyces haynaldii]|nr:hypothetical protein EDD86DRAFT_186666 [Gorgonomyces haynaldii]
MVQLHLKKGEESLFLHETVAQRELSELIPEIVKMHNLRKRLQRMIDAVRDLLEYGALKQDAEQGYTEEQLDELAKNKDPKRVPFERDGFTFYHVTDPTGRRIGEAAGEEACALVNKTLADAEAIVDKENARKGIFLKTEAMEEALKIIFAAVTMIYPRGLPEWEPVREINEDNEDLTGTAASKEVYDPEDACLWWAGKELVRNKKLSDFIGKNEKTKLVVKIQRKGAGAPLREPTLSEQEQKNLMAYYYKKQEQQKKLEENEEDDYLNSPWADTKSLKKTFTGMSNVKFRPI